MIKMIYIDYLIMFYLIIHHHPIFINLEESFLICLCNLFIIARVRMLASLCWSKMLLELHLRLRIFLLFCAMITDLTSEKDEESKHWSR